MRSRAERGCRAQGGSARREVELWRQLLLPMVEGMITTKQTLFGLVQEMGIVAAEELFRKDAERLAGRRGKRQRNRKYHHWGSTGSLFPFAGRSIVLRRPRVRTVDGKEGSLPLVEELRAQDPVPERVIEQILLGVSTRGYGSSLGPPPSGVRSRGASKSATSRHIVARTAAQVAEFLTRRLEDLDLPILMIDGLSIAEVTVVVALGIDSNGVKHPLGLWLGSTENAELCIALLHNLLERGLNVERRLLVVIDGAKGLRKALEAVFGDAVVVQRCQLHKLRNVKSHLPKSRHTYVSRVMREAYAASSVQAARKRLASLVGWLESNGHVDAARSLREGLQETLTVLTLGVGQTLRRTLSTTNPIENLIGTIRTVTRNVKNWRNGRMVQRWAGLAVSHAARRFRRVKGYRDLPALLAALEATRTNHTVDRKEVAA